MKNYKKVDIIFQANKVEDMKNKEILSYENGNTKEISRNNEDFISIKDLWEYYGDGPKHTYIANFKTLQEYIQNTIILTPLRWNITIEEFELMLIKILNNLNNNKKDTPKILKMKDYLEHVKSSKKYTKDDIITIRFKYL